MGQFFLMSRRFNKSNAQDFGLVPTQEGYAVDPKDGSIWIETSLLDLGWGNENGYYKTPLPNFEGLYALVTQSQEEDDAFGAASILLDCYADLLLERCEALVNDREKETEFQRLCKYCQLYTAMNRSSTKNKPHSQVHSEYLRWKRISDYANAMKTEKCCTPFGRLKKSREN